MSKKATEIAPPETAEQSITRRGFLAKQAPQHEAGMINEREILRLVPVSRRTWGTWKAKGIIPFIKLGRRCIYDWSSVREALLRRQRGGE
jgi:hypothetical protein